MSYLDEHPTNFLWLPYVEERINRLYASFPWRLFICTYWDHPPGPWPDGYYDKKSFDVWYGGPGGREHYNGFRGRPLPRRLGRKVHHNLFWVPGPAIDWIIWNGRMWWNPASGGPGWTSAPSGPIDSDPGHFQHIHVTLL